MPFGWYWRDIHILCPFPYVHPHASSLDLFISHRPFPSRLWPAGCASGQWLWISVGSHLGALSFSIKRITRSTACPLERSSLSSVVQPVGDCKEAVQSQCLPTNWANSSVNYTWAFSCSLSCLYHTQQQTMDESLGPGAGTIMWVIKRSALSVRAANLCPLGSIPDATLLSLGPSGFANRQADRTWLSMSRSGRRVNATRESSILSLLGLSNMSGALFSDVSNSPLQMAWSWARTPRSCDVILLIGFLGIPRCIFFFFLTTDTSTPQGLPDVLVWVGDVLSLQPGPAVQFFLDPGTT